MMHERQGLDEAGTRIEAGVGRDGWAGAGWREVLDSGS